MKYGFFFLIFWVCCKVLFSQSLNNKEICYWVPGNQEYFGIKDEEGNIILPAVYRNYFEYKDGETFSEDVIEILGLDNATQAIVSKHNFLANTNTIIFDRNGKLLYYPLWFDNGSDSYQEGLRRIVDIHTGKVGYVNKQHQVVVQPQWDYASTFNYGYAHVFNRYEKKYFDKYKEHWSIVPIDSVSETYVINAKGERVNGYQESKHPYDYYDEDMKLYFYYPFKYSKLEDSLLKVLNDNEVLFRLYLKNHYPKSNSLDRAIIRYEISEKTDSVLTFTLYYHQRADAFDPIYYDLKQKKFYLKDYENNILSYHDWIKENLIEASHYFEDKPDEIGRAHV